ncbi:MAG: hypothetical protein R2731_09665 [Nocardioides sp.]
MAHILWLAGTAGAGKSVTAWEVFQKAPGLAYVDIDQLGMLYPDRPDDEEAHRLKQEALRALAPQYLTAGAERLLVSGVVDPELAADPDAPLPPGTVDYCLLVADPDDLRRRILERGWEADDADRAVATQELLVVSGFAESVVHTQGRSVSEVSAAVPREASDSTAPGTRQSDPDVPRAGASTGSVFITGPRAVGCSTVGFALASHAWELGVPTGFVDLDQLSFRQHGSSTRDVCLGIANLGALQRVFARHGAERFIANGHLLETAHLDLLRRSLGPTTVVCLRADHETLRRHLVRRLGGSEARLAGDDLADASDAYRRAVLRRAVTELAATEQADRYDIVVDVAGRSVTEVVAEIAAAVW